MDGAATAAWTVVALLAAAMAAAKPFNVPMFIEFNNYRASQRNITFVCVNEITGGQTAENSILPFRRTTFTVTPDAKFNVYAELTCYFYTDPSDGAYLVAVDPYAGMGPNVDPLVLQYEWNIGDACFDLVRHYVNGTKLTPCLYLWPRGDA